MSFLLTALAKASMLSQNFIFAKARFFAFLQNKRKYSPEPKACIFLPFA
jgi:hypothetical protein